MLVSSTQAAVEQTKISDSQAEGSCAVSLCWPLWLALVEGTGNVVESVQWGCSEAYARLAGWRASPRG